MPDAEPPLLPPSPAPAPPHPLPPVRTVPSRLRRTLHSLRSPFRAGPPFHLGSIKHSGSDKSIASDSEITRDERTMRKRSKKTRDATSDASRSTDSSPGGDKKKKDSAGSLLRRMGSIGKKRTEEPIRGSSSQPETSESTLETPPTLTPTPPPETVHSTPQPVSPIAVEHPVATRPFTKAAWKRNSEPEMEKPVEEPSPESAVRRRIAFVAQTSARQSDDRDGERGGDEVGSLEEAVALARSKLTVPASSSLSHSRDNDAEEGCADAMPAYGDLIEPENKPGSNGAPVTVSNCGGGKARARRRPAAPASGQRFSVRCARAMTFEEVVQDNCLTVCECCGFSTETTVLFPVRYISR